MDRLRSKESLCREVFMKISAGGALYLVLAAGLPPVLPIGLQAAQNSATRVPASAPAGEPNAPATPTKIDPAKDADIRHLLEAAGTAAVVQTLMDNMEQNLRPMMSKSLPPGEYREKLSELFFEKFRSKLDTRQILDLAIARYDENFSDEEIKSLISFYETPLGHKVVTLLPKLTAELQQDGQKLGQQVGREAMIEVLSEHPEIAQALQEASRRAVPSSQ